MCVVDAIKRLKPRMHYGGHKTLCKDYQKRIKNLKETILTKEFLYENLIVKNVSSNYIALHMMTEPELMYAGVIINRAKEFGIPTKSLKAAANLKSTRDRYKKTCLEKYGEENCLSAGTTACKKRDETVKERYGVDNIFQLSEVKDKSKETMIRKYGVSHSIYLSYRHKNNGLKSKCHIKMEKLLEKHNIKYESEVVKNFTKFNDDLQREYNPRPDIIIEDLKTVIEIYGDRWHANPKIFKKSDIITLWTGDIIAEEMWKRDASRQKQIESFGYTVIIFWENELRNNKKAERLLCERLKLNPSQSSIVSSINLI
jgi:G:T-mismatch repair DNA endonuclease (very short patch repair protein)